MPRYHFDCAENGTLNPDRFGMEMPLDEVADQAVALANEILGQVSDGNMSHTALVTVRDAQGEVVCIAQGQVSCSIVKTQS